MGQRMLAALLGLFLFMITGAQAEAQFYKVYGYSTPKKGEMELSLWTTHVVSTSERYAFFGEDIKREGLWAHSLEFELGVTDHFTLAAYVDSEDPRGAGLHYTKSKVVFTRYRFLEKGDLPVDAAIYLEYIVPDHDYEESEELETRIILEKDIGNFRLRLNPILEKKVSGEDEEGIEFNYAAGAYWRNLLPQNAKVSLVPGIEFHGKMGEISDLKSSREQKHFFFPTLDIYILNRFHWHLGAGFGLTEASDDVLLKSIFSVEL